MAKPKIVPHTLTVEINFYSFPVDANKLAEAGVKADLAGKAGRVVFGVYTSGPEIHDVLFVERGADDDWETCSEEIEGERVHKILSALKFGDSVDLLAELHDGAEEQAMEGDSEDFDDGQGPDGDEDGGDGWEIQSFEEDEKLFVLPLGSEADAAKIGTKLLPGPAEVRVIFGYDADGRVLFVERKNKWWRRASAKLRDDAVGAALKALGREDGITFLQELADEEAAEAGDGE